MPNPRSPARRAAWEDQRRRFEELKRELQQVEYFCKGTVLRRMMKCGKAQCACQTDPSKRHGPYFEWTYKANGKTVNVKLSAETAPLYQAASRQYRRLKTVLNRLERLSQTALRHQAQLVRSARKEA
jgi:uncharacterized protein DUF6788